MTKLVSISLVISLAFCQNSKNKIEGSYDFLGFVKLTEQGKICGNITDNTFAFSNPVVYSFKSGSYRCSLHGKSDSILNTGRYNILKHDSIISIDDVQKDTFYGKFKFYGDTLEMINNREGLKMVFKKR